MNEFRFDQTNGARWVIKWDHNDATWKGSLREYVFHSLMSRPQFTLVENRIKGGEE